MGPEATAANEQRVDGKTVYLEKDASETGRCGRLPRYVRLADGHMVNDGLCRFGFAQMSTHAPGVKYQERMLAPRARNTRVPARSVGTAAA